MVRDCGGKRGGGCWRGGGGVVGVGVLCVAVVAVSRG